MKRAKARTAANHRALIAARIVLKLGVVDRRATIRAVAEKMGVAVPLSKQEGYDLLRAFAGMADAQAIYTAHKAKAKASKGSYYAPPRSEKTDVNSIAFLQSYEWRSLRMRVLKRFGAKCQCCGASAKDGVRIHVDHIKPRREFPELALVESNLQVLCEECNHGKGNWDQTDWREQPDVSPLPDDWNTPMWTKVN